MGDTFYPKGVKTAEGRLRYYAHHFNTVEVDSTYYAIPNLRNTSPWGVAMKDALRLKELLATKEMVDAKENE